MKKVEIYKYIKKDFIQLENEEDFKSLDGRYICLSIYRLISNADGSSQYRPVGVVLQSGINNLAFNKDGTLASLNFIDFQVDSILVYDMLYEEE